MLFLEECHVPLLFSCASSLVRLIVAACSLMAVLVLSPVARAGTYVWQTTDANGRVTAESPAYTGGMVSATPSQGNSLLPFTTHPPYAPNTANPFYRGYALGGCSTDSQGNASSVTLTAAGQLTAKFTWQPAYPGEPAPTSVIVYQDCQAVLTNNRNATADTSCVCTDGLGGNAPLPSNGAQTESYKYSAGTVASDGTVSVSCTPNAVYNIKCPAGVGNYAAGEAFAAYKATAYPITINFTGTTPDSSGGENILVGQGCTASVSGIPADLMNNTSHPPVYNWSVGGNTFQDWAVTYVAGSSSTAHLTPGPGPTTNPTAHWYWSDTTGQKTVSCAVTITPPDGQGPSFTVTVTKAVSLQVPINSLVPSTGRVQTNNLDPTDYGTGYTLYAGAGNGNPHGITCTALIQTPALFATSTTGIWNYVQLVTPNTKATHSGQAEQPYPAPPAINYNGYRGLDTTYPLTPGPYSGSYPGGWSANNVTHVSFDGPAANLRDTFINYNITETFITYVMYSPPGNDTRWVPISYVSWYWTANDSIPDGGWANWDNTVDAGIVRVTVLQNTATHPEWSILIHQ